MNISMIKVASIAKAVMEKLSKMRLSTVPGGYKYSQPGRVIASIVLVVLNMALLTACGDNDKTSDRDSNGTFNVLLSHKAGGGSLEQLNDGTYRLTLHDVAESTGYSAMQPEQASGDTSTKAVIDKFQGEPDYPLTGAVVITDPAVPDSQNAMIVNLTNPVYDMTLDKLSFDIQPETSYQGYILAPYVAGADASIPASFGSVNVVVDSLIPRSCSDGLIQCYTQYNVCSLAPSIGKTKVHRCWAWSSVSCQPCSSDPCGKAFPDQCGNGNCYSSCEKDPPVD